MILTPRYDGPVVLDMDGAPGDQLVPLVRQRERMAAMLASLDDEQWAAQSRCEAWTVREVVAHLVGVDEFWHGSVVAGLGGEPTRMLGGFDPAATPAMLVGWLSALSAAEVLQRFVETSSALLDSVRDLDDEQWMRIVETPAGHVPVRLLAAHALWDCWVHERDIAVPLGLEMPELADEVSACLRYCAALSPALAIAIGRPSVGRYAVRATDPPISFGIDVGESIVVREGVPNDGRPELCGPALQLVEGLSLRAPLPTDTPDEWLRMLDGIGDAFT